MTQKTDLLEIQNSMRVSSIEQELAIQKLQTAFEDGRLNERELDERMALAVNVKTHGELSMLIRDLPSEVLKPSAALSEHHFMPLEETLVVCSGLERKGFLRVPQMYNVTAVLGGISLDLSQAEFCSHHTQIQVVAVLGGVEIFLPPSVRVHVDGMPILGGFSQSVNNDGLSASAPMVTIRGTAVLGGVDIRTKTFQA